MFNANTMNSTQLKKLDSVKTLLENLLNEEFECAICLDACKDTYVNPDCHHRFCGKCIKESLRRCNQECPSCREPIPTYRMLRKDPVFDRLQEKIQEIIETLETTEVLVNVNVNEVDNEQTHVQKRRSKRKFVSLKSTADDEEKFLIALQEQRKEIEYEFESQIAALKQSIEVEKQLRIKNKAKAKKKESSLSQALKQTQNACNEKDAALKKALGEFECLEKSHQAAYKKAKEDSKERVDTLFQSLVEKERLRKQAESALRQDLETAKADLTKQEER